MNEIVTMKTENRVVDQGSRVLVISVGVSPCAESAIVAALALHLETLDLKEGVMGAKSDSLKVMHSVVMIGDKFGVALIPRLAIGMRDGEGAGEEVSLVATGTTRPQHSTGHSPSWRRVA
jgi:hypothetical protein